MKSEKSYDYDDDEILECINCGYKDEAKIWKKNQDRCIQCQSYSKVVFIKIKTIKLIKDDKRRDKK